MIRFCSLPRGTLSTDVIEATAIEETAFVLPCIEQQGDVFPTSQETASYFLVFPPRSEWKDIWCQGEEDDDSYPS